MANKKKDKSLVQAWLWNDGSNERHALAVEVWEHLKKETGGLTADIMAESLIAYNEKLGDGFEAVPDKTPALTHKLVGIVQRLESVAQGLKNIRVEPSAQADMDRLMNDVKDVVTGIDFNIVSDTMTFDTDDDDPD